MHLIAVNLLDIALHWHDLFAFFGFCHELPPEWGNGSLRLSERSQGDIARHAANIGCDGGGGNVARHPSRITDQSVRDGL